MNEFYATLGIFALPAGNTGAQMGGWFRKEINTLDDLKGLKMRIAGLAGKVIEKLRVVPQQSIPINDVYAARGERHDRRGGVGRPYDDLKLGFQKIAKVLLLSRLVEGGAVVHAFFNLERSGTACRKTIRRSWEMPAHSPTPTCWPSMTCETPRP